MNHNGIVSNILTLKKYIVFCIALFTNTIHCFDTLPNECVKIILLDVLKSNWKQTQEIALVSTQCNRIIINIIHDVKLFKEKHLELAKTGPIYSPRFAQINAPHMYEIYTSVNDALLKENNLEQYVAAIEKNPYADPNYMKDGFSPRLRHVVFYQKQMLYKDHCITPEQTQDLWIEALCKHGTTVHQIIDSDSILTRLSAFTLSQCIGYNEKHQKYFPLFTLLLKHAKKEITEKHLLSKKVFKRNEYNSPYLDGKPFMQDSVDYLKLIKTHGFKIEKIYSNPLHFHLHKNPHPAPAMIEYLLEEKYDPYECVDMHDGSEPQSAYAITQTIQDPALQGSILELFESTAQKR